MPTMDPGIKAQWVAGLRSAAYRQGFCALRRRAPIGPNGLQHCSLGVLCDLYVQAHPTKAHWDARPASITDVLHLRLTGEPNHGVQYCQLPTAIMHWAGLDSPNPRVRYGERGHFSLTELNDTHLSFAALADIIETQL